MRLHDFQVLSFDCYGTLIDWETGLYDALAPLRARAGVTLSRDAALEAFARLEARQQALTPSMPYADLLAEVHRQLAAAWGVTPAAEENAAFGASVGDWPAFPDTPDALRYLKQHFRLVILSNVDRHSFTASNRRLGVEFDAIHTAQDIGSYKPDPRNFTYLLDRLAEDGFAKSRVLHVAQSLFHDHVPANAIGLASAWIDRRHAAGGWGATVPVAGDVRYDFRFPSLETLAEAHRAGG
jgi:2-haloalkanoic acid dehalogenase type II